MSTGADAVARSLDPTALSLDPALVATATGQHGMLTTSQARAGALVQHAIDRGIIAGVVSADAALRERKVTMSDLEDAVRGVRTWPHASHAASMLRFVDGRRESVGESQCGVALAMAGIAVTPQVAIHDERGELVGRVDFLVNGTRVVVEFDGKVKYASGDGDVLWKEKRREDRLRGLGYTVVRLSWADLERPGAVAAAVRRALGAVGRGALTPEGSPSPRE